MGTPSKITFILLYIFFYSNGHAQIEKDTLIASGYFQKADSLFDVRKLDKSTIYFKKALVLYQKAKVWDKVARCYNKISKTQWATRQLEKSIKNSNKAIEICKTHFNDDHPEMANAYDNKGNQNLTIPNYNQALLEFEKALSIRQSIFPPEHRDLALSYSYLALVYNRLSKFDEAIGYNKKAVEIYSKTLGVDHMNIGLNYNNIGYAYGKLGKFNEAIDYYKKSVAITIKNFGEHHRGVANSYINIGSEHFRMLKLDMSLKYFKKGLNIFEKSNYLNGMAIAYTNIGSIFSVKGEDEKALDYYEKSLKMEVELFGANHPQLVSNYNNIGGIFENRGNIPEALKYFDKSLQILKSVYGEYNTRIGHVYKRIGSIHLNNKDYDKAEEYYKKALMIYEKIYGQENHLFIAKTYGSIADNFFEKGLLEEAISNYSQGIRILENLYGTENKHINILFNGIGTCLREQNKYNDAISYFDKALISNCKYNSLKNFETDFNPKDYFDLKMLLATIREKSKTLQSKFSANESDKTLKENLMLLEKADILIDYVRESYRNHKDKLFFEQKAKEIYSDAIRFNLVAFNHKNELTDLEKMFYYSEKSKANTLKGLIKNTSAEKFSGLPQQFLEIEKEQKTDLALYNSLITKEQLNENTNNTKIKEYENKLFDINRKQDSLTEVLEQNYPKYYQLKYQNEVISIDEIQEKLSDKATLLEFFVSDSNTYVFSISKNDFDIKELKTPNLTQNIEELRSAIINKDIQLYKKKAHLLYTSLLAPVKEKLVGNELIIIPDESLWHLNFDLLLSQEDASNNPQELPYLMSDYAISYANSATLLFQDDVVPVKKKKNPNTCLAFSFSDSSQLSESKNISLATLRNAGDDLPGTRKEIKAIADIIDGQYFFGKEASEARFKKNASQYEILHLALHGEIDDEQPENSKLFFTKNKDTIEDNLLYAHELFALDIPAELVVLSACNTGAGKIAKGEGIMSLGTAFQYAGTKSLVLTGWEISDLTTPELMKNFYGNLKKGMDKSKALQQAKLQYLQSATPNRAHPLYWGGFYLVGDHGAMDLATGIKWYWIVGCGVLGIVLLLIFYFKKRKAAM